MRELFSARRDRDGQPGRRTGDGERRACDTPRRPGAPRHASRALSRRCCASGRRGGRLPRRVPGLDPHHQHAAGHAGALARGRARRRRSGASTRRDFTAYYLGVLAVRLLTSTWVVWQMSMEIRDGTLSAKLLRPDPPALRLRGRAPGGGADARAGRLADRRDPGRTRPAIGCCDHDPVLLAILLASLVGAWLLIFFTMVLHRRAGVLRGERARAVRAVAGRARDLLGLPVPLEVLPALDPRRRARAAVPLHARVPGRDAGRAAETRRGALRALAAQWGYVGVLRRGGAAGLARAACAASRRSEDDVAR